MTCRSFRLLPAASLTILLVHVPLQAASRDLSLEERIRAQRAIERIYYSYQIGAETSFDAAVPPEVTEAQVRRAMRQSSALATFWKTPIPGGALRQELDRIERGTRFPDRLEQIYQALEGDPLLLQECLARPILVDRLAHSFFESDERIHA